MPSTCVFEFDRPQPIYYSGETVNGRIILQTTSEKSCREIYIQFRGEAKVRWEEEKTETRDGKTETYTEYYSGEELYVQSRTKVFNGGTLPPGTHTYTFSIPLPTDVPSSCVEKYGHISYEISLVIDRPFRFDNVYRQPMTVLKQLNLNLYPEFLVPLQGEDIKYFCCWPCSSGPVISNLNIQFGGYAPGQKIKYTLLIDNQSHGYDLEGIRLSFIQTYTFTAHSPHHETRSHSVTLAETGRDDTVLRLTKKILDGTLLIPPVPPTSERGIITVRYHVELDVKTGGCHTDSKIVIPIVIGTVPLAQSATNPENIALITPTAPTPDTPGYDPDKPPSYDLIKPPSYEQATTITGRFVDTDIDEHNRVEGFIPKYPMYTNFALPTAPPIYELLGDTPNVPILREPPPGVSLTGSTSPSSSNTPYSTGGPNASFPMLPTSQSGNSSNIGFKSP